MNFDEVDHHDPEQIKRQKSACSKKLTPVSLDENFKCGTFEGSSKDYLTTLKKCECVDFSKRKLPCKHIYRLAHELGVYNLSTVAQEEISVGLLKKDLSLSVDQIIKILPRGESRFLKWLLNKVLVQKAGVFHRIDFDTPIATLIKLEIIKEAEDTPKTALRFYKINEIKEMLKSRNLSVPTANRWKVIEPLAIEQVGDLLVKNLHEKTSSKLYEISPVFEPIWGSLYHKLTKAYPGEYVSPVNWIRGNLLAGDSPELLKYIHEYIQCEYDLSLAETEALVDFGKQALARLVDKDVETFESNTVS